MESKCKAIKHSGDSKDGAEAIDEEITFNFAKINAANFDVKFIAILVNSYNGIELGLKRIKNGKIMISQNNTILINQKLENGDDVQSALLTAIFYKKDGEWRVKSFKEYENALLWNDPKCAELVLENLEETKCFDGTKLQESLKWNKNTSSQFNVKKNDVLKLPLDLKQFKLGLGWSVPTVASGKDPVDCDASVILLDKNGDQVETIYYKNKNSTEKSAIGAVKHSGDIKKGEVVGDDETIEINLDKMPDSVKYIIPTINVYSKYDPQTGLCLKQFDDVNDAYCRLYEHDSCKTFCRYNLSSNKDGVSNGCIVCIIFRIKEHWALKAFGIYTKETRRAEKMIPMIKDMLKGDFSSTIDPNLDIRRALNNNTDRMENCCSGLYCDDGLGDRCTIF